MVWSGWRYGPVKGACEQGNELSVSIEDGEFLEKPNGYWFLKKDSAPLC
jgi:hypothetical protein